MHAQAILQAKGAAQPQTATATGQTAQAPSHPDQLQACR